MRIDSRYSGDLPFNLQAGNWLNLTSIETINQPKITTNSNNFIISALLFTIRVRGKSMDTGAAIKR